jgi:hypothetical protein
MELHGLASLAVTLLTTALQEDHGNGPPSTRVACTIGDVSNSVEILAQMLKSGMAVSEQCTIGDNPLPTPSLLLTVFTCALCRWPVSTSVIQMR